MFRKLIFGFAMFAGLPAGEALTADLAPEGKIDVTWTYVNAPSSMPTEGDQEFMMGEATIIAIGNIPGSLLHQMSGRCMMSGPNDLKGGAFKLTGRCTYRDGDGDMIFATDEEGAASMSDPARGVGKFVGGTGKYTGITGGYDFTDEFFIEVKPGVFGGGGTKKGSYKIVK